MRPYTLVTSADLLPAIASEVRQASAVALDLETARIGGGGSVDPLTGRIRLCSLNTGKNRYVIDAYKTEGLGPVASALNETSAVIVGQNIKFDQKWLLWHYGVEFKKVFDCYRASNILYAGLPNIGHDLWSLYKRELKENPEVEDLAASDWDGELTQAQLDYAADDVDKLLRLREVLKPKLVQAGLVKIAQLEFQAVLPEASIELNGFYLDSEMWLKRAAQDDARRRALEAVVLDGLPNPNPIPEPPPEEPPEPQGTLLGVEPKKKKGRVKKVKTQEPFNLNSPAQVLKALQKLGVTQTWVDPETRQKSVVPLRETKEITLAMEAEKWPILEKFIEFRGYAQACKSFGPDYLENLHPVTERIHCSYYPYTDAGRYACVAPWTPVRTREGIKPIRDIRVGDEVWTHKGRWRTVTAFLPQGTQPTYAVRFSNGEVLTCTDDHRILLADGSWKTVRELYDERIEDLGAEREQPAGGFEPLQESRTAEAGGHRQGTGDDFSQRSSGSETLLAGSGTEGAGSPSVLRLQGRVEEPDARQEGRGASQLEGAVRGRVRLSDLSMEREAVLRTPRDDDGSAGSGEHPRGDGRTPHRRQPEEQHSGQPSARHETRASRDSLVAGAGQSVVSVAEIHPAGSLEVYDLTVDEDESYETCGVFSHNCSKPNLQQIPRGKAFRECFRAEPGRKLAICDWSNIEMRLVAEISKDKALIKVFQDDRDAHYATAALLSGKEEKDITKPERQQAKPVNFGFIYGMQAAKLVLYAKAGYGVSMSEAQAKKFRRKFFEAYYGIAAWHEFAINSGKRIGETRTLWGRRRLIRDDRAHNEFFNSPVQGSGADGLKNSLRVVYDKIRVLNGNQPPLLGKGAKVGMIHMVHDEIILEHIDEEGMAEAAQKALYDGMMEGMAPMMAQVPTAAEVGGGDDWSAK